jgi:hypothetical protein
MAAPPGHVHFEGNAAAQQRPLAGLMGEDVLHQAASRLEGLAAAAQHDGADGPKAEPPHSSTAMSTRHSFRDSAEAMLLEQPSLCYPADGKPPSLEGCGSRADAALNNVAQPAACPAPTITTALISTSSLCKTSSLNADRSTHSQLHDRLWSPPIAERLQRGASAAGCLAVGSHPLATSWDE